MKYTFSTTLLHGFAVKKNLLFHSSRETWSHEDVFSSQDSWNNTHHSLHNCQVGPRGCKESHPFGGTQYHLGFSARQIYCL